MSGDLSRDFAPDLLAMQENPPARLPRLALLGVAGAVGLLIAWAALARLDIVATAPGRLVPATFTKVVQPAEPGVVAQVLVRDGDVVSQGQVLLRLDERISRAEAQALQQELSLRRLTLARIDAELSGRALRLPAPPEPDAAAVVAQVQAQFEARRRAYEDQLAVEQAALARIEAERGAARQVLAQLREVEPIVRAAANQHAQLAREGFVSALAAADRQRELVEKAGELQAQAETLRALDAAQAQQLRKLDNIRSGWRAQLENERLENLTQHDRLLQEQDKGRVRAGQLEVRAPADGIVKDLAVTAPGAVVQAGAVLLNIVPRQEPLQAEVSLGHEDVGFVHTGQAVRLKLAAYPFQQHGLLEGVVSHVAADTTAAAGGHAPPAYRGLVRLAAQQLDSPRGEPLPLAAGMQLVAEIHQGERSVLEYLLSPVHKVAAEAARER